MEIHILKLSICIPTYNRSGCLSELLNSIVAQGLSEIEVVVSDDASTDDTVEVAAQYQHKIRNFVFIAQPKNIGLDRNFIEVTRAASGDYLWLMGDDDRIEPNGVQYVLDALKRWPDVVGLTLGVVDYDQSLQRPTGIRKMPETQLLIGASAVFSSIAELLGFMSAMVVDRRRWDEASMHPSAKSMDNLYSQVYIIGMALGSVGTWGIVKEFCVGFRSDNDQFKRKVGAFERLKIDVRAYEEISDRLFSDDPSARAAMRARIFNSHVIARLVNSKMTVGQSVPTLETVHYLFRHYASLPQFWIRGLPVLMTPRAVLRVARSLYKRFFKSSGAARARHHEIKKVL